MVFAKNNRPKRINTMKTYVKSLFLLPALSAALVTACSVQAQFTEVNISSQVNADIQGYANGINYQLGGTQLNSSGVPFALAELNNNPNTTGVVQGGGPSQTGLFNYSFLVPAGTHATVLYTLLNNVNGISGINEGSIVVTGTGGETATLNLTEGYNIRDFNNNGYVNTLTDPTVVPNYFLNGAPTTQSIQTRLDRQELVLPGTFSGDTIASITFQGDAQGEYNPNGAAFLAGLTLENVPEPSTVAILTLGAFAVLGLRRRK
jgi:PEP-CTERM motif